MEIDKLINEIFSKKVVFDENGKEIALSANIDQEEGAFLKRIVQSLKPERSIEVGCANGVASLFICSELEKQKSRQHTIIDPYQSTEWNNVGKANLKRAGIDFFELIEKPSEIALPELYAAGKRFDFGFIDGWHTFDHTLIDFFYIDKMININGIIVIDDVSFPSINKLIRYILINYPSYIQVDHLPDKNLVKPTGLKAFGTSLVKNTFKLASKLLPSRNRHRVFASNIIISDERLNLGSSMIALKKIKEDERSWDWYKDF
jgi:predicted O-methyltransferase YrrM